MVDRRAAARAIADFLRAIGREPEGDLEGTPERVADAWADDLLEGESIDPAAILREGGLPCPPGGTQIVAVHDLVVATMCPHHLLPAYGAASVAFMPEGRLVGIGTLSHVLDVLARRLTLQETIGTRFVDLLTQELGARGAFCRLRLTHTCLVARGERKTGSVVETLALGGSFAEPTADRDVALAMLAQRGS